MTNDMKALEQESIEALRKAWQKRTEQEKAREQKRRQEALARAEAAARHLKEKYGVTAVYLFGSLVWGRHFTPHSDIDLLVEGFQKKEKYWQMFGELEEIASPFEINIVLTEEAAVSLREKVTKEGKLL